MPSTTTREAFRFMLEHAGYATPPGRAVCALDLARAEQLLNRAVELGVASIEWVDDDEPYDTDDAVILRGLESGRFVGPGGCVVQCGDAIASLWGIVVEAPTAMGDDPYVRVVAAELALEIEDDLRQAIGDAGDANLAEILHAESIARSRGDKDRADELYARGCAL